MEHLYRTIVCTHCGQFIRVPVYCKDRFCEVCGPGRRFRVQEKIKYLINRAQNPPGYFLAMITVSLPNSLHLGEGIRNLQKSFRRLRSTKLWKSSIRGGLYVIEIKGSAGNWHPHIHAIVEQKYISWRLFRDKWKSLTGATAFHVQKIPSGQAAKYITKYISKPPIEPSALAEVSEELRHVRLFQPFGLWHGLLKSYKKLHIPARNAANLLGQPSRN